MNISKIILDNGFKCQTVDVLNGEAVFYNEFYWVKVNEFEQSYFIAQIEDFDNWDNSVIQSFKTSEKEDVINDILDKMSLSPLKFKNLKSGSICGECSFRFSLTWPKWHVATHWFGECSQCQKDQYCCSTGDWNYRRKKVFGMRD